MSARLLQVATVPQLEHEQRPEGLPVVASAGEMVAHEPLDLLSVEKTLARDPRRRQLVLQQVTKVVLEPRRDRNPESLLPTLGDPARQDVAHRRLEQVL